MCLNDGEDEKPQKVHQGRNVFAARHSQVRRSDRTVTAKEMEDRTLLMHVMLEIAGGGRVSGIYRMMVAKKCDDKGVLCSQSDDKDVVCTLDFQATEA